MNEEKVLVSREFQSIDKESFIKFVQEDIARAKVIYDELSEIEAVKKYEKGKADKLKDVEKRSHNLYKREFYRKKYVEECMANFEKNSSWYFRADKLTYVDWKIKPWCNGGCTSITPNEDESKVLSRLYDEAVGNKYFEGCTGWSVVYGSRPRIKLHLSAELEAEWKADEKKLSDDIARFYSGSNYWGD